MYTYIDVDKNEVSISQPQFQRNRHRYRGPKESYKINLEMDQFHFDVRKLFQEYSEASDFFDFSTELLYDGGVLPEVEYVWDDSTPLLESLQLEGIESLACRVEALHNRIRRLER